MIIDGPIHIALKIANLFTIAARVMYKAGDMMLNIAKFANSRAAILKSADTRQKTATKPAKKFESAIFAIFFFVPKSHTEERALFQAT